MQKKKKKKKFFLSYYFIFYIIFIKSNTLRNLIKYIKNIVNLKKNMAYCLSAVPVYGSDKL